MARIVIFLVVLLLLGGGAGAYFYLNSSHASVDGEAIVEAPLPTKIYSYVAMAPIILPIIDQRGVTHTVSIVVSLQVENAAQAELVKNRLPLLTDAYLSDMYGTLSRRTAMDGGVLRVSMVKERLKSVTDRILPKGVVEDVLLQVVQQYPG